MSLCILNSYHEGPAVLSRVGWKTMSMLDANHRMSSMSVIRIADLVLLCIFLIAFPSFEYDVWKMP